MSKNAAAGDKMELLAKGRILFLPFLWYNLNITKL
jgi:hypothetical protein